MNTVKKALALVLALAIVMSLGITAFAAGETYQIVITNPAHSGVSIKDETFTAYKIFDATYSGDNSVTYKVTEKFKAFSYDITGNTALVDKFNGNSVTGDNLPDLVAEFGSDSVALNKFAQKALAYAKQEGKTEAADKVTVKAQAPAYVPDPSGSEKVTITVNSAGYYVIDCMNFESSKMGAVSLTTAKPTANVVLKYGLPTLEKNVSNAEPTGVDGAYSAEVGKILTFTLDTVVPNMAGYEKFFYQFVDTRSKGLTLVGTPTVEVYGRTTEGAIDLENKAAFTVATDSNANDYSVKNSAADPDGNVTMKITFKDLKAAFGADTFKNFKTGDIMRVTYNAKLNADALKAESQLNKAYLVYSNNPAITVDPENPDVTPEDGNPDTDGTGKTPLDSVKLYNVNLDTVKVGMVKNPAYNGDTVTDEFIESKLAGAKFLLYKEVTENGTGPATVKKYYYSYDTSTNAVKWTPYADAAAAITGKVPQFETDSNGVLKKKIQGLEAGTYFLEETVAPSGFVKLKDPIEIQITAVKSEDGMTVSGFNATVNSGTTPVAATKVDNHFVLNIKVLNTAGEILPETGGIGTTIFYTVGGLLMVSALVLLITKKKMSVN